MRTPRRWTVPSLAPTSKVTATGTAAGAALVLVWTLRQFGVDMPAEVAAGAVALLATAAGYLKTERRGRGKGKHSA